MEGKFATKEIKEFEKFQNPLIQKVLFKGIFEWNNNICQSFFPWHGKNAFNKRMIELSGRFKHEGSKEKEKEFRKAAVCFSN